MGTSKKQKKDRRFTGGGARPDLREMRQREAKERQERWTKLSPREKLAELDRRLGVDVGAEKQRAKLTTKAPKKETKKVEPKA